MKMHFRRWNAISFSNYMAIIATTILVMIIAHAKSSQIIETRHLQETFVAPNQHQSLQPNIRANFTNKDEEKGQEEGNENGKEKVEKTETLPEMPALVEEEHHQHAIRHHLHHLLASQQRHNHHKHHHHVANREQAGGNHLVHHKNNHYHFNNKNLMPNSEIDVDDKRSYRSKFSIEQLLNTQFEKKVSNDIDMDPCKAGKFLQFYYLPNDFFSLFFRCSLLF